MVDVCKYHDQVAKDTQTALEGKVAKSSLKWIAGIFALPVIGAILAAYAFIVTADYRYGTSQQAVRNAYDISILTERSAGIKAEIQNLQATMTNDLGDIKKEVRSINKELMRRGIVAKEE